jgi:RNA-directed DNA polymerase
MSAAEMPAGAAPDRTPDWHSISWSKVWQTVRRLQVRIVKAVAEGRWNQVQARVYRLTHSFSGRALAILRGVSNSGAKTPGGDGVLGNTPVKLRLTRPWLSHLPEEVVKLGHHG